MIVRRSNYSNLQDWVIWPAFIFIGILGLWACLNIGVGADENAEFGTLSVNLLAIKGLIKGDLSPYRALLAWDDRYYGIGFHLPAGLLSFIINFFWQLLPNTISYEPIYLLNHVAVWLSFLGSAILIREILKRLNLNDWLCNLSMMTYLLWPYLLGHGLMNIKDTPFLFAWMLCTWQIVKIVQLILSATIQNQNSQTSNRQFFLLAFFTAWLCSIRISGLLIFIEYASLILSAYCAPRLSSAILNSQCLLPFRTILKSIAIFFLTFILLLICMYPIAWHNPLEIWYAIEYMGHHPWIGTTLTAGRFLAPGNQLFFYFLVWTLAKLPLIVLIGLLLSPLASYKLMNLNRSKQQDGVEPRTSTMIIFIGLLLSAGVIIFTLLILNTHLYNELRQVLFLFPILFILGICSFCIINVRFCIFGLLCTLILSALDNWLLYPYNYTHINEIARLRAADNYFESDYFGFSASQSARWLAKNSNKFEAECIYGYPPHLIATEFDRQNKPKPCIIDSKGNGFNVPKERVNYLYITQRNLINFPIPNQCILIHSEERIPALSRQKIVMGKLFKCGYQFK